MRKLYDLGLSGKLFTIEESGMTATRLTSVIQNIYAFYGLEIIHEGEYGSRTYRGIALNGMRIWPAS